MALQQCHDEKKNIHDVIYKWKIKNFLNRPEKINEKLISPVFYSKTNNEKTWRLEIFPRGDTQRGENYIALYVRLNTLETSEEYENEGVNVICELSIINPETKKECYDLRFRYNYSKNKSLYGYRHFISRDVLSNEKNGFIANGILIINCKLRWHSVDLDTPDLPELMDMSTANHRLCDDLKILLGNTEFSDVTLIVEGERIPAHKMILATRSPVFAAIFKNPEIIEDQKNEVEIKEVELRIVAEMLKYIYTDQVEDEGLAVELLVVADRYQLDGLKARCEGVLVRQLNPMNAVEMLAAGENYNAHELKTRARDFIKCWGIGSMKKKSGNEGKGPFPRDVDLGEIPEIEMEIVG